MMFGYGLLVCLLVGWAAAQDMEDTTSPKSQFPNVCQRLVKEFKWCAARQNWTNVIQEYFAKVLAKEEFVNRTRDCLRTVFPVGQGTVACTESEPMEIMLHCSRMAMFKMVAVEKKVAAMKFHTGFQHCVMKNMGFIPETVNAAAGVTQEDEDDLDPLNPKDQEDYWYRRVHPENADGEEDATYSGINTPVTREAPGAINDHSDEELEEGTSAWKIGTDSNGREEQLSE